MSKHIQHEDLGLSFDLPALKQRDADAFFSHLRVIAPGWREMSILERASAFAKAAVRLGWYPGWTESKIDECEVPGLVGWLGVEADKHLAEYITVPPNSKRPSPATSEETALSQTS